MAEHNGNVKWWQLGSVIIGIATIMVTLVLYISEKIIAVDRTRASEDERVQSFLSCKIDKLQGDVTEIKVSVARMESKGDGFTPR